MLGEFLLTQHDLQKAREKYDSIGMAGYNIDVRELQWLAIVRLRRFGTFSGPLSWFCGFDFGFRAG